MSVVTRVHVIARSPVIRAGLEAVVRRHAGFDLAETAGEADVILTEAEDGELPTAQLPLVVLGDNVATLLRAGARAAVPRDAGEAEIHAAITAAAAGLVAAPASAIWSILPARMGDFQATLTPREIGVLRMLAEGHPNKTIAWRLGISEHTVKFHVASIFSKLNVSSRTEAVTAGVRLGLVLL